MTRRLALALPLLLVAATLVAAESAFEGLAGRLQANGSIRATFLEQRSVPFRRDSLESTGTLRFSPDRGLSLEYAGDGGSFLIVDEKGVVLRDARGRSRRVPADHPSVAPARSLLALLRFDPIALETQFDITLEPPPEPADAWHLRLTPRGPVADDARAFRRIEIDGRADQVQGLRFISAENRSITIRITSADTHVEFSTAELERCFR